MCRPLHLFPELLFHERVFHFYETPRYCSEHQWWIIGGFERQWTGPGKLSYVNLFLRVECTSVGASALDERGLLLTQIFGVCLLPVGDMVCLLAAFLYGCYTTLIDKGLPNDGDSQVRIVYF